MLYLIESSASLVDEKGERSYFMILKIGFTSDESNNPSRIRSYSVHNPTSTWLHSIPFATLEHESKLHKLFKSKRFIENPNKSVEWFYLDDEIINYFKSVTLDDLDKLPEVRNQRRLERGFLRTVFEIVNWAWTMDEFETPKLSNLRLEKFINKVESDKDIVELSELLDELKLNKSQRERINAIYEKNFQNLGFNTDVENLLMNIYSTTSYEGFKQFFNFINNSKLSNTEIDRILLFCPLMFSKYYYVLSTDEIINSKFNKDRLRKTYRRRVGI